MKNFSYHILIQKTATDSFMLECLRNALSIKMQGATLLHKLNFFNQKSIHLK